MTVLLTGGGTGGHITPLIAVAHELKQLDPTLRIIYVGERGGKFDDLVAGNTDFDEVHRIFAGKFRRYHGEALWRRLLDLKTWLLNVRDFFYFIFGLVESLVLVKRLKPDIILLKGGFVGLPVGLSAAFWHKRFVTHDSDAIPGLSNRIAGRWAYLHATGQPAEFYSYPKNKIKHVGVLVSDKYQLVDAPTQALFKSEIGFPSDSTVLFVTGGSNGAQRLNEAMRQLVPQLLSDYPQLQIVHQVGKGNEKAYGEFKHERLVVSPFVKGLYRYSGAADVIVTRAGATNLAEFGVQGKACVVVPNPILAGGHQLKNAEELASKQAVLVVDEGRFAKDTSELDQSIRKLLDDETLRHQLAGKLQALSIPDAARKLAQTLIESANARS